VNLAIGSEIGADAVAFAQHGATGSILPFRPRSLRRPFLSDVAERRFDFAERCVANGLIGSPNVNLSGFGKPSGEGLSKQGEIGAAVNMHQQMKVFSRPRLAHKNGMESFG